jgi:hypothetical protein
MREKVSRPSSSAPRRCSDDGPASGAAKSVSPGEYGAISGAKIAISVNRSASTSPVTAIGRRKKRRRIRVRRSIRGAVPSVSSGVLMSRAPRSGSAD